MLLKYRNSHEIYVPLLITHNHTGLRSIIQFFLHAVGHVDTV